MTLCNRTSIATRQNSDVAENKQIKQMDGQQIAIHLAFPELLGKSHVALNISAADFSCDGATHYPEPARTRTS